MIAAVRGTVLEIGLDHAVIEVGGIRFEVRTTPATLATLRRGEEAKLATTLVVREDSLTLFGFADNAAKELFGLLQTVSGIGPRLALATLAVLEPDALRAAIADGNITTLTRVPGIGRKGAERLIIELRDKVGALPGTSPVSDGVWGALNYDILVDSPIEIGDHYVSLYERHGALHEIAITGAGDCDRDWLAGQTTHIIDHAVRMWGSLPYDRYVFIIQLLPGQYGGLEHARWDRPSRPRRSARGASTTAPPARRQPALDRLGWRGETQSDRRRDAPDPGLRDPLRRDRGGHRSHLLVLTILGAL